MKNRLHDEEALTKSLCRHSLDTMNMMTMYWLVARGQLRIAPMLVSAMPHSSESGFHERLRRGH